MVAKRFNAASSMRDDDADEVIQRICRAAAASALPTLHALIDSGVNINIQDGHGMTPLHVAAAYRARSCVVSLLATGKCDLLLQDKLGQYASDLAIEWGRDAALGRLLTKHQIRQARERGVPAWEPPKAATQPKELTAPHVT